MLDYDEMLKLINTLYSIESHLSSIQAQVKEVKTKLLLNIPEGPDDDTFLTDSNSK